MSKVAGREQVFQLGVNFVKDRIEEDFKRAFLYTKWNHSAKETTRKFFKEVYSDLKVKMPFLKDIEYPRVSIYIDMESKLKVDVQGWLHHCMDCNFLGSRWFNKNTFYDFYVCSHHKNHNGLHYIIRYGDNPSDEYSKYFYGGNIHGAMWWIAKELNEKKDDMVIIDSSILRKGE